MKIFAVQTTPGEFAIDSLHEARHQIGHAYIHRPAPDAAFMMVCHPLDEIKGEAWLTANGWTPLAHPLDTEVQIGESVQKLLAPHSASVAATDNTAQALKKIYKDTGIRCFHPFRGL